MPALPICAGGLHAVLSFPPAPVWIPTVLQCSQMRCVKTATVLYTLHTGCPCTRLVMVHGRVPVAASMHLGHVHACMSRNFLCCTAYRLGGTALLVFGPA